jgi:hypothetical protein
VQGKELEDHKDIEQELKNYLNNILSKLVEDRSQRIDTIACHIHRLVSDEKNVFLMSKISSTKVEGVVKEMASGKALGSNGSIVDFFNPIGMMWVRKCVMSRKTQEERVEFSKHSMTHSFHLFPKRVKPPQLTNSNPLLSTKSLPRLFSTS